MCSNLENVILMIPFMIPITFLTLYWFFFGMEGHNIAKTLFVVLPESDVDDFLSNFGEEMYRHVWVGQSSVILLSEKPITGDAMNHGYQIYKKLEESHA